MKSKEGMFLKTWPQPMREFCEWTKHLGLYFTFFTTNASFSESKSDIMTYTGKDTYTAHINSKWTTATPGWKRVSLPCESYLALRNLWLRRQFDVNHSFIDATCQSASTLLKIRLLLTRLRVPVPTSTLNLIAALKGNIKRSTTAVGMNLWSKPFFGIFLHKCSWMKMATWHQCSIFYRWRSSKLVKCYDSRITSFNIVTVACLETECVLIAMSLNFGQLCYIRSFFDHFQNRLL